MSEATRHDGQSCEHSFKMIDRWAEIPDTPSGRLNGRTHGIEVLADGRIAVFCQAVPSVLFYDRSGRLLDSWGDHFLGAHGMSLSSHQGQPALWLIDEFSCDVVKTSLSGETLVRLEHPPTNERPQGKYVPTWADQADQGEGDIWVGDGYGGHAVHRYHPNGRYRETYTAFAGTRLNQPHGLRFAPDGRLWLTDRSNHRIIVLNRDGEVELTSRTCCHSPCSFAFHNNHIYVAELFGAVKILDSSLQVVGELGANPWVTPPEHWAGQDNWIWPMDAKAQGYPNIAGTEHYYADRLNSPHGIAVDPQTADIYVSEWMIGGRVIKFEAL